MKKVLIIFFLVLCSFTAGLFSSQKTVAQTPTPMTTADPVCYSQCAAYKFYWNKDYCWDVFQANCTQGKSGTAFTIVKFLFNIWRGGAGSFDISAPFKATFYCAPIVEQCIAPNLHNCDYMCKKDTVFYAPNLNVTSSWLGRNFPGLRYDDTKKTLTATVMNDGMGLATNIDVVVSWGSTKNRDKKVSGGGELIKGTIPMLRFRNALQNGSDTPYKQLGDWIISQSDVLTHFFPPDPTINEIPFYWEKTIPFDANPGEFTKFYLNADPSNTIPEGTETDNTYILEVDKLPTPHKFSVENFKLERKDGSLTDFTAKFDLKNTGEESGDAVIKWFDQKYSEGIDPFATSNQTIAGKSQNSISQPFTIDVSNGSSTCGKIKMMSVIIADADGIQVTYDFPVYLLAGVVEGTIKNSSGRGIANAAITANTGQTTTSDEHGFYHLTGIDKLGRIQISVTHPDYTKTETKEVEIKYNEIDKKFGCEVEGLFVHQDFVLRDIPLTLHLKLKSQSGQPVTGRIIFTGGAGTFTYDDPGQKDITEMEPGQYRTTAMAAGYVTKEIQTVLTPPEQTVEITLEPLGGRNSDEGLGLQTPAKLWDLTIGTGKVDAIAGTKNGKLLVVNTNDNIKKTGLLTFVNPIDGTIIKSVSVPFTVGQLHVALDISYDGRTVGYMYSIREPNEKTKTHTYLKIFDAAGDELGTKDMGKSRAASIEVSPDGYWLYPNQLMNSALYTFTRQEIEGKGGTQPETYSTSETLFFLWDNTMIAKCKEGHCIQTISKNLLRLLGKVKGVSRVIDASRGQDTIAIRTDSTLNYYGKSNWQKDVIRASGFTSMAVTPGGEYVIAATGTGNNTGLKLVLYNRSGNDDTPQFTYKDVRLVEANDRGLFYTSVVSNKLSYYQLGKYNNEYNPTGTQTTGQALFGDFQGYINTEHKFEDFNYLMSWDRITSALYRPKNELTMTTPWGTLALGKETVISRDNNGTLVLLWGQAEINANSPIKTIVIKNKLNDPEKFVEEMDQWIRGTLPADKYVIIENLHTKYVAKSNESGVTVEAVKGDVTVQSGGRKQEVKEGEIAEITGDNEIKVGFNWLRYLGWAILVIIMFIAGLIYSKYRNNPIIKKTIQILKKIIIYIFKNLKILLIFIFRQIKKLIIFIIKKNKKKGGKK